MYLCVFFHNQVIALKLINILTIIFSVPTKYVRFQNISGDVFKTIENIKTTLTCETSEGRPAANITWTKISKKGIKTDITYDAAYAATINETLTERNLIIVTSSINFKPEREDNDTRIICEATNRISNLSRKEIIIYVQCKFYPLIMSVICLTYEVRCGHIYDIYMPKHFYF